MKKFYTILAVAALAVTSSNAATPELKANFKCETGTKAVPTKAATMSLRHQSNLHKSPAKAASANVSDLYGHWQYDEYRATSNGGYIQMYSLPTIQAGTASNEVILNDFWLMTDEEYGTTSSPISAKFDPTTNKLTIPAGSKLGTLITDQTGTTEDLYIYLQDWNTFECYNTDIALNFDPAERTLWWEANSNASGPTENLIVISDPNAIGKKCETGYDYITYVEMNKYNSLMLTLAGTDQEYSTIYAASTSTGFTVDNFGGWGFHAPVDFTIDKTAKTVSAPKSLYGEDIDLGTLTADVFYASTTGGDITGTIEIQDAEGGSGIVSVVTLDAWTMWCDAVKQSVIETPYSISQLILPFDALSTGSVESILANDSDAPVEYFNLQGVRVANPEAGQLVIKRQGSTVTKVIVR